MYPNYYVHCSCCVVFLCFVASQFHSVLQNCLSSPKRWWSSSVKSGTVRLNPIYLPRESVEMILIMWYRDVWSYLLVKPENLIICDVSLLKRVIKWKYIFMFPENNDTHQGLKWQWAVLARDANYLVKSQHFHHRTDKPALINTKYKPLRTHPWFEREDCKTIWLKLSGNPI